MIAFLVVAISATACASGSAESGESQLIVQSAAVEQRNSETIIIIDVVPLLTPVATQFVLGLSNELQVFHYEQSRLAINEVRRGKISDDAVLSGLRRKLDGSSRKPTDDDTQNPELLEDDQYRMQVCDSSYACQSVAGGLASASPALRKTIDSLKKLAEAVPVVSYSAWHLRCIQVPDAQWSSIQRRGTYGLTEAEALPEPGQRAVDRAMSPVSRFSPLSTIEAEVIDSRIALGQVFIRYEGEIVGCELYYAGKQQ